jgi:hypothetical protein
MTSRNVLVTLVRSFRRELQGARFVVNELAQLENNRARNRGEFSNQN